MVNLNSPVKVSVHLQFVLKCHRKHHQLGSSVGWSCSLRIEWKAKHGQRLTDAGNDVQRVVHALVHGCGDNFHLGEGVGHRVHSELSHQQRHQQNLLLLHFVVLQHTCTPSCFNTSFVAPRLGTYCTELVPILAACFFFFLTELYFMATNEQFVHIVTYIAGYIVFAIKKYVHAYISPTLCLGLCIHSNIALHATRYLMR